MEYRNRIKYPCGLEIESSTKMSFMDMGIISTEDKEIRCPFHGKNCPNGKGK